MRLTEGRKGGREGKGERKARGEETMSRCAFKGLQCNVH